MENNKEGSRKTFLYLQLSKRISLAEVSVHRYLVFLMTHLEETLYIPSTYLMYRYQCTGKFYCYIFKSTYLYFIKQQDKELGFH